MDEQKTGEGRKENENKEQDLEMKIQTWDRKCKEMDTYIGGK